MSSFIRSLDHLAPISARLNDADEQEFEQQCLTSIQRRRLMQAVDEEGTSDEKRELERSLLKRITRRPEPRPGETTAEFKTRFEASQRGSTKARERFDELRHLLVR